MAPPIEPPTHITLRIKVPPGHLEGGTDTFTLPSPVAVTTKIGGVRDLIQTSLPSNPPPERQRLLYFGRALVDNDQTVADALNIRREPSQTEYVVHLLVRGTENAAPAPRIASPSGQPVPPQHGLPQQFQQHHQQLLQQAIPHQHLPLHGVPGEPRGPPEQFQPEILLAQARLRQEQLQAELRMLQAQALALNPRGPQHQPQGGQPTPPNVPSQQAHTNVPYQQTHPNAPSPQAPTNAPAQQPQPNPLPLHGQPRTHNVFVQGVGPNGERIAIHQQQRFFQNPPANPHHVPPLAHGLPFGALGAPPVGMQNQQNPQHPQAGPSSPALDRAREQIAALRQSLEEIRAENPPNQATPEQLARIARMEEQARNINDYIDPLNLSTANANQPADPARRPPPFLPFNVAFNPSRHANGENAQPTNTARQRFITPEQAFNSGRHFDGGNNHPSTPPYPNTGRSAPRHTRVPPPTNPEDVTCYLLSDPTGLPQALLLTPQHGSFTGTLQNNAIGNAGANLHAPHPQPAAPHIAAVHPANQARVVQAVRVPANGEVAVINPMGLLLRHFWLLLRIMIFSYFLLGSNMGWRRPLALGAIAFGFWLMRAGMFGDGGVVRGWWDEIVREGAAAVEPARPAGAMPTPEEVARRLMEERRRGESEWVRWGRERVRAVVLLLASLWPGVGEAFVRAREAEERRLMEEEVAEGRRREEEAAARAAADEAAKNEREGNDAAGTTAEQTASGNEAGGNEQAADKSRAVAGESAVADEATVLPEQANAAGERHETGASTSSSS